LYFFHWKGGDHKIALKFEHGFFAGTMFGFEGIEHIFGDHGLELMGVVFPHQKKQDVNIKCIP